MENKVICGFGALASLIDLRDYRVVVPDNFTPAPVFALEIPNVKNQGSVNSCVAHALSSTVEYFNHAQNNDLKPMSVGFIYGNRKDTLYKKQGMYVREALSALMYDGDVYENDFVENVEVPECIELFDARYAELQLKAIPHQISAYFKLKTADEIKYSLMNNGPVIFSIGWYSDMAVDENGVLRSQYKKGTHTGNHCMLIYGWDERGWLFQNSWGKSWGNQGKAVLPYDAPVLEFWGVIDNIYGIEIKRPFANLIWSKIIKAINWLLNLFKKGDK